MSLVSFNEIKCNHFDCLCALMDTIYQDAHTEHRREQQNMQLAIERV